MARTIKKHHSTAYKFKQSFQLGTRTSFSLIDDPMHISFVLSRYKFCARMLSGCRAVLEVGCGDGIGTPIVAQYVEKVVAIDMDGELIRSNRERLSMIKNITFRVGDMCREQVEGTYDAVFSIDVLEHIDTKQEDAFMRHTVHCLTKNGICIIGTPNSTADVYASVSSRGYHVNLKSQDSLRQLLHGYFMNVFMFSMNDEVVHTGFGPMAHYLFGMGVGVR